MDTTLKIQVSTVTLAEIVSEDVQALLAQVGFSTDVLERLLDPKERIARMGWAAP